jgi:uncharacterized protein YndB with AHSA1/START domain
MKTAPEVTSGEKQKTLTITRTFDAPVSEVWKAWTLPDSFKKWWGPTDFTCPVAKIDLRPGGKGLACMKASDGKEYWSICTYREIVPEKKLVYQDQFSDSNGNPVSPDYYGMPGNWGKEVIVTIDLQNENGKTKMTLQHEGIPEEMKNDCIDGWQQSFDKMERSLK